MLTLSARLPRPVPLDREATFCVGFFAVVIAAVTRLGWLGLVEFKDDESWALTLAESIARGRALPSVGIGSSLNVPNPPLFVYLMALPELISRDPAFATALVALLGVGAVAVTFGLGAYLFGDVAGAAAALFYSVSPWGIIYSRKVWEQDALPLFVALGFWALFAATRSDHPWLLAPGVFLLALAVQLHPTALYLAPAALLLVVSCVGSPGRRGPRLAWLALGVTGGLLAALPFLLWQARHGWPSVVAATRAVAPASRIDLDALRLAGSVVAGNGYLSLVDVPNAWDIAKYVEAALFVTGLALIIAGTIRPSFGSSFRFPVGFSPHSEAAFESSRLAAAAVLIWLAAPVILQTRHAVPLYPHYFIILYPAPFLVMGLAISALWRRADAASRAPCRLPGGRATLALLLAIPTILGMVAFREYLSAVAAGAVHPDYGVPLDRQVAFYQRVNLEASGGPVSLGSHDSLASTMAYFSDGQWTIFDDRGGLWLAAGAEPGILAFPDPSTPAAVVAARQFGPSRHATIDLAPSVGAVLFRTGPNGTGTAPGFRASTVAFSDGLVLSGYRIAGDRSHRQVLVDLDWKVVRRPEASPTVFNHLLDSRGETVSQRDGPLDDHAEWRVGEIRVDEFALPWPTAPGPYHLEIGLYTYPGMHRLTIVDPVRPSPADTLDLGPVDLSQDGAPSAGDRGDAR